jgi:hypothetical protein
MVSVGSQGVVAWCGVQSQHIMGVGKRRTNLVQVHHRPSRSIKMNFTSIESSLPMDIWEDIFQAMHLSGDFVGLKRCSSLNYAFRATLSPRIFASALITLPVTSQDVQLYFMPIVQHITHLSIRAAEDSVSTIRSYTQVTQVENVLGGQSTFIHMRSLSMHNLVFQDLDELSVFLCHFPVLRKLAVEAVDMKIRVPPALQPPSRLMEDTTTSTVMIDSTPRYFPRIEELEMGCNRRSLLPKVLKSVWPVPGIGQHLKHLKVTVIWLSSLVKHLVPWIGDPACCLTSLDLCICHESCKSCSGLPARVCACVRAPVH